MPRTPAFVLLVAAALSVAACTAAPTAAPAPPAEPAPAPTDVVAWIDRFCGVVIPVLDASGPAPVDLTDPQKAQDDASRSLDALGAAAATAIDGLDRLGPAPTPSADALVSRFRPVLSSVRTGVADARSAIDGGSGAAYAVGTRNGIANVVRLSSPAARIAQDPGLSAAAAGAATCAGAGLAPPS